MNPLIEPIYNLLKDPAKWTKRFYARDASGLACPPIDSTACSFCLIGAIAHIKHMAPDLAMRTNEYKLLASNLNSYAGISEFNDSATHEELLARLASIP